MMSSDESDKLQVRPAVWKIALFAETSESVTRWISILVDGVTHFLVLIVLIHYVKDIYLV